MFDYGTCSVCGQPMVEGDELHTAEDGVSDIHEDCCIASGPCSTVPAPST